MLNRGMHLSRNVLTCLILLYYHESSLETYSALIALCFADVFILFSLIHFFRPLPRVMFHLMPIIDLNLFVILLYFS